MTNTQRDTIGLSNGSENHNDIIQTWYAGADSHSLNTLFESNYIKDNYGQLFNLSDGDQNASFGNWTFRNNVWIGSNFNGNPGIENVKFYNNTFYHTAYNASAPITFFNQSKFHSAGQVIKNNLFVSNGRTANAGSAPSAYTYGSAATYDYNMVTGIPPYFDPARASPGAFSEVHGINGGDPLFVSAATGDLRIRATSPVIGAGVDLSSTGFTTDYAGNARGSSWDIGAYEFAGSIPPPPTDTTPPVITSFAIPATATSLTVPITAFTATDNVAVTGYLVTETATAPAATAAGWSASAPTAYTFASAGSKTLYAWAKDAAGKVSGSVSRSVTVTLSSATPKTYYVATTGNDADNGSASSPWKTIQKIAYQI